MKQIVVIKDSSTSLYIDKDYIVVNSNNIIAFRYIKALYLNKNIDINISKCLKLARCFKIYFIDRFGNIIGNIELNEKI